MGAQAVAVLVDKDAEIIGALVRKARASIVGSVAALLEAGKLLVSKRDRLAHGEWHKWLDDNAEMLGLSRKTACRLATVSSNIPLAGDLDERDATRISRLIWDHKALHGTQGTGEIEWHTPAYYIELARLVLGTIDLDPASSAEAQKVVKARKYFSKNDDGLAREWQGRVWLNPPYARELISLFSGKLAAEMVQQRVTAAVMLVNSYTDTGWFQELAQSADAVCFTRGRIAFISPTQGEKPAPIQGQAFFYFGAEVDLFIKVFSEVGCVLGRFDYEQASNELAMRN